MTTVAESQLDALARREDPDPHAIRGAQPDGDGVIIRARRPAAAKVSAKPSKGKAVELEQIHPSGIFEGKLEGAAMPLRYKLKVDYGPGGKFTLEDPYAFWPTLGDLDLHLIGEGHHEQLWDKLASHVRTIDTRPPVQGTSFAVWAPAARAVSVVGDFNSWDGRLHPMRSLGASGVWELFLPDVGERAHYKYEIRMQSGQLALRADPVAFEAEIPPGTASRVFQSR